MVRFLGYAAGGSDAFFLFPNVCVISLCYVRYLGYSRGGLQVDLMLSVNSFNFSFFFVTFGG